MPCGNDKQLSTLISSHVDTFSIYQLTNRIINLNCIINLFKSLKSNKLIFKGLQNKLSSSPIKMSCSLCLYVHYLMVIIILKTRTNNRTSFFSWIDIGYRNFQSASIIRKFTKFRDIHIKSCLK